MDPREPVETIIRLTPAQRSALECAGLDLIQDDDDEMVAVRDAWSGGDFVVRDDTIDAILSGLIDMINAEDTVAIEQNDRKARGACTALGNLHRQIVRLRYPNPRTKGDDDGVEYADPRDR